ncbi:MAG: PAS domain S-box protein [Desulfamplus sp.]|nr:PAS domain S-box protein [Desulfamplus sp.]MBF0411238.1 PAS domain S-box protein [Desulfamplus sp.]
MIYGNQVENHYLLKAIETIKRQIIIISYDYKILASNCNPNKKYFLNKSSKEGEICYHALFNFDFPCKNCPATEVKKTGKPSLKRIFIDDQENECKENNFCACLYAYPMAANAGDMACDSDEAAIVVLDFDLPSLFKCDEKRVTSNSFLRNLINSAADGVIAADMTGKIIIFNKAATEISGYSRKEALEHLNIRDLYPQGDAYKIMKKMRSGDYGGNGLLKGHRQLSVRKDGSTTPIVLNASIVYEDDKEVASIGFFHDLREAKRLEAEIEKMQIQLLQAEKMSSLGKLAAGVAHQLNNPLGGITLFTQLMLEEYDLNSDAREDLLKIQRDAERCSAIVKELLEFARQTKREVKLQNINKIVGRTLFLLRNQAIFQNIQIIEKYDPNIPEIPVDMQQLNHVFMNIILNAADSMEGSGVLEIRTFLKGKNGISSDGVNILHDNDGMVHITIADTGPGIPAPILPNIFEPFFTTKEEGKGTGLGLSMAYGIVESHQGKLTAENRPERGAIFSISLPLKKENHQF